MKILFLNYEFFPIGGGGSTVTNFLAEGIVKKGHEVHLITSRYKNLPLYEIIKGVYIHRVKVVRKHRDRASIFEMLTYIISAFFYSKKFIKKETPEIIHAFFVVPSGVVAYVLYKRYKIPYIVYLGGSDVPGVDKDRYGIIYNIITPFIKIIWNTAMYTIAASEGLKEYAQKVDTKQRFTVIPNGVDLSRFKPQANKKKKDTVKETIKLLAIGRLIPRKGFQYLLQALPEVLKTKKKFQLDIIGSGPYQNELQRIVKEHKLESYVRFLGLVEYEQLLKYYQEADVLINASYGEGMPLVVLEAMGTGLPIIATKVPGNEELVKHGVNGYLIKARDPQEMADALIEILASDTLRIKMRKESLKIIQNYSWDRIVDRYITLYKKSLKKKPLKK